MAQLKLNPAESIADEIRRQASALSISVNAYIGTTGQPRILLTLLIHFQI